MGKYFYDDALEAAYMCKHFGMRFHTADNDKWLVKCHDNAEGIMVWWTVSGGRRLYVDEDCVGIMEPQTGDLCQLPTGYLVVEDDKSSAEHLSRFLKIIQRNGKAFFMPELSIDSHLPTVHIGKFLKDK